MLEALTTALPPYAYDLVGLLVILIFAFRGARRGLIRELTSALSLLAAVALARPFGSLLQGHLPLSVFPSFLHASIAWSIGGVLAYLLTRILLSIGTRWSGLHREQEGTLRTVFQIGGAGVRGCIGLLVCVAVGWSTLSTGRLSTLLLQAAPSAGNAAPPWLPTLSLPLQLISAHSQAFSQSLLGTLSSRTNPLPQGLIEGTEMLAEITQHPENIRRLATYDPIRKVIQQPSIQQLLKNKEIGVLAEKQDILGLLNHPAVKKAMEDPAVQEALKEIDPSELRRFLAK